MKYGVSCLVLCDVMCFVLCCLPLPPLTEECRIGRKCVCIARGVVFLSGLPSHVYLTAFSCTLTSSVVSEVPYMGSILLIIQTPLSFL
jgi:hypothetical protein